MIPNSDPIRDGNVWVFPNGRTLPVISGGADEGGAAPAEAAPAAEAPAAAPAPSSAPDPSPAEATPPPTSAGDDAFDIDAELGNDPVVSRGYAEKIRRQAQQYREQAQATAEQLAEYEQVYGQYEAEDRQAWFAMATEWANDPRAGAEMMQRIADAVLNEGKTPEEATEAVIAEDQLADAAQQQGINLTPEQVQAMVDERLQAQEAERAQKEAVDGVFNELRAAGFDPQSREGHSVLWTANHETGGDIAAAIEIVKAERQKVIDEYVAGKSAPTARTAPADGMLATPAPVVGGLDDAFKAANSFLDGLSRQPG